MAQNRALALAYLGYLNPNIVHLYTTKIITYGRYQEHHIYKKVRASFKPQANVRKRNTKKPKSYYALSRAQQKVLQIIEANHLQHGNYRTVFFTPTFKEQYTDRKQTDYLFRQFIKRLNRYCGHNIKYIAVPERLKNDVIHYHCVIFNLPFINAKYLDRQIWTYGHCDISVIKNIRSIQAYVSKYITKELFSQSVHGQKTYLSSRGLLLPQVRFTIAEDAPNQTPLFKKEYEHKTIVKYEQE